jgi:outer membrane receptor protein involved in Fe transport
MPASDATRDLRQVAYGLYLQDDIQVKKNFTLNAGIRYEPNSSITDTKGRLAQLIDFASPTATLNDTTVLPDGLFKNPSFKTVAPRLGFAWDVNGKGTTAIRGGAGIFYDDLSAVMINDPSFGLVGPLSDTFGYNVRLRRP